MDSKILDLIKTTDMYSYIMGCSTVGSNVIFTTDISFSDDLNLNLYDKKGNLLKTIDMKLFMINSFVSSVTVSDPTGQIASYSYIADGVAVVDKYAKKLSVPKKWGDSGIVNSAIYRSDFDWSGDCKPSLLYAETISYLLHVRGYSMEDTSISKSKRGTFGALIQKIPYFKDMGINQLILMPSYDFNEKIDLKINQKNNVAVIEDKLESLPGINYWGYTYANYFAPKGAFATHDEVNEFKELVKQLHMANIEIIMQFYFPEDYSRNLIPMILKYWITEYHVDGFYLMGINLPIDIIFDDTFLADSKFYFNKYYLERVKQCLSHKNSHVSYLDDDYHVVMRKLLKSDEDMLNGFVYHIKNNPSDVHVLNYITNVEGFTLNDLVSYDRKHNEDNLEDNRDGNDFNYSWNCGSEGPSKKKNVSGLRIRQIKNILTMLMLSQGTPMLLGGDENLNSQNGNNNAYCQDNKIGHVDWKETKDKRQIHEYLKELIVLRKNHPILHMKSEMKLMDFLSCGYPDISFHQDDAYRPHFEPSYRHIGIMFCGKYAIREDGSEDDYFYAAFNMHWQNQTFALPRLPKNLCWNVEIFTGDDAECKLLSSQLLEVNDHIDLPYRSIALLRSSVKNNK